MKMIHAVIKVLENAGEPLKIEEIYEKIIEDKLFQFSSKNPLTILSAEVRRNSLSIKRKSRVLSPCLEELEGDLFRLRTDR